MGLSSLHNMSKEMQEGKGIQVIQKENQKASKYTAANSIFTNVHSSHRKPIQKQSDIVIRKHYTDHDCNATWRLIWNGGKKWGGGGSTATWRSSPWLCYLGGICSTSWLSGSVALHFDWWEGTRLTRVPETHLHSAPFITSGRRLRHQQPVLLCLTRRLRFTHPQFVSLICQRALRNSLFKGKWFQSSRRGV